MPQKIVCEKRLYEGTEVCRYIEEPRIDLWGIVTTPPEPPPFREVVRTPVRLFRAARPVGHFAVRLRFLVYMLRQVFRVKSVERISFSLQYEHLVELHVFVLTQEEADREVREFREAIYTAMWMEGEYVEGVVRRARKIRQGGGNAKDRRKRRRLVLSVPAWWEQIPDVEAT